jgi:hypothetical protein
LTSDVEDLAHRHLVRLRLEEGQLLGVQEVRDRQVRAATVLGDALVDGRRVR